MGAAVSAGADNDELVSNLCEANYITSASVETSFRIVDRGNYFPGNSVEDAYKDLAWKQGNVHISAPCIYCEVMEALEIEPGMSFLNIGSGTGYLSTLVGLLLGPFGSNHGIELHSEVVKYAYERLDMFLEVTPSYCLGKFCKPSFFTGNFLNINPEYRQYDRVYCGAGCPHEQEAFVKSLVKPDGVLIMPITDNLVKYKRLDKTHFERTILLPVQFSPLLDLQDSLMVPHCIGMASTPLTLKEICRSKILSAFPIDHLVTIEQLPLPFQLAEFLEFKLEPAHRPAMVLVSQ